MNLKTALRIVSGQFIWSRIAADFKDSGARLQSLFGLSERRPPAPDKNGHKHLVYSPFTQQYFVGDDFAALLNKAFTHEQIADMTASAATRKNLFVSMGVVVLVMIAVFVMLGKPNSLWSLSIGTALLFTGWKHGVFAERLRQKRIIGLREYLFPG